MTDTLPITPSGAPDAVAQAEARLKPGEERILHPAQAPAPSLVQRIAQRFLARSGPPRAARRRRTSWTLRRRIIAFNLLALVVLIGGSLWVNTTRAGLIDERILSLTTQGRIIASALAENATGGPEATGIDDKEAAPQLRQLVGPTDTRARLYATDGELLLDTRFLLPENTIITTPLPPPGAKTFDPVGLLDRLFMRAAEALGFERLPPYTEVLNGNGQMYEEVVAALGGNVGSAVRLNASGELILSVAVPVQRFQYVLGVLFLSTEGGDIDSVIHAERTALLQIAALALGVMVMSSVFLARTIAGPVRTLADAAETVRRIATARPEIPEFTNRKDEIGDLSAALKDMTHALYARIDAIEQFAADVAHEIKNPLTSLKSAVETFERARDDETRARLIAIIRDDVTRITRLVSDISDASRLDAELARERAEPVDVGRLLRSLMAAYTPEEAKRGVTVQVRVDQRETDLVVDALEGPLAQVFRNVIDNAVSFSPDGGAVRVAVERRGGLVLVTVDDDGPGIPEDSLSRIFERFFTERPPEHGFGKNSGLGLSISRQIIDVHRGQITASNRRAADGTVAGARFTISLPGAGA